MVDDGEKDEDKRRSWERWRVVAERDGIDDCWRGFVRGKREG